MINFTARGIGFLGKIALFCCLMIFAGCSSEDTATQSASNQKEPVTWKVTNFFPGSLNILGTMGVRITDNINLLSDGEITIKYFEPGALVPPLEIFDAVSFGAMDAGFSSAALWAGKVPALQIFSAVPFGPAPGEYMAWIYNGGGREIYEELYHRHNIHALPCGILSPEASGWFRKEINNPEDLKGLKMRIFGLGANVMSRIGVSTQLMATGDIFPALELGTIDATEFSMPAIDAKLGFQDLAEFYYFPGWHQQASFMELIINLDQWNKLDKRQQKLIDTVCKENITTSLAESEALQAKAIKQLKEQGVNFRKWSPEILNAYKKAWAEVVAEESAKDPDFKRAWQSLNAFREEYKTWNDLGYLK